MARQYSLFSLVMAATISMAAGAGLLYWKNKDKLEFSEKYSLMLEAQEVMKDSSVGLPKDLSEKEIVDAYLSLYGDEYAQYIFDDEKEEALNKVNYAPTAYGCGFELAFDDKGQLYFSKIEEDMPADQQGFCEGDIITSIDGVKIQEADNALLILGKQGTKCSLELVRDGKTINTELSRVNDTDRAMGVGYEMIGDVLYIRYYSVANGSSERLRNALEENSYSGVIVDIRDNGGGNEEDGVKAADCFASSGDAVLHYYNGNETVYNTTDEVVTDKPVVVLANQRTASSAEQFLAFLMQYSDAVSVGEQTFGKGVFQDEVFLRKNIIRYTAGTFTVGDWPCWQGVGIAPDIEVKMDPDLIGTDDDIQLQKALEILG